MIRTCGKCALTIYGKTKEVSRNHKTKWSSYRESSATFYFCCPLGKEKWDRDKTNTHNYIAGCVKRFESLRNAWMIYILKTTYYGPFIQCNISLRCPQNVSVKFQLKIPNRSFIISFWKCLFWVEAETHCFRACFFKCKWAAASHPIFQYRAVPLQLIPQILCKKKKLGGFDYRLSCRDHAF